MPRAPKSRSAGGELALIELIRSRAEGSKLRAGAVKLGIGDDCAILAPPRGHEILVTTDFSLETRHFRREWHSSRAIGHRALARGLSDLAAMGAVPMAAFLSLALPREIARKPLWINGFLDGLMGLAEVCRTPLAGGDTSESPGDAILADIVLMGSAPAGRALRRSGAKAGDLVYVTGALGGAAAELAQLAAKPGKFRNAKPGDDHPHLFPQPRLAVGQELRKRRVATACIDVSDGLSTDLRHLCEASGVGAEIDAELLPAHALTAGVEDPMAAILHGGEDYELVFTAGPKAKIPKEVAGVPVTRIGRMLRVESARHRVTIVFGGRSFELRARGWEHLK